MVKCKECGEEMNPVQAMLSQTHGVCGDCTRKKHKEAVGPWTNVSAYKRLMKG